MRHEHCPDHFLDDDPIFHCQPPQGCWWLVFGLTLSLQAVGWLLWLLLCIPAGVGLLAIVQWLVQWLWRLL
jgi:hypothetical protein